MLVWYASQIESYCNAKADPTVRMATGASETIPKKENGCAGSLTWLTTHRTSSLGCCFFSRYAHIDVWWSTDHQYLWWCLKKERRTRVWPFCMNFTRMTRNIRFFWSANSTLNVYITFLRISMIAVQRLPFWFGCIREHRYLISYYYLAPSFLYPFVVTECQQFQRKHNTFSGLLQYEHLCDRKCRDLMKPQMIFHNAIQSLKCRESGR